MIERITTYLSGNFRLTPKYHSTFSALMKALTYATMRSLEKGATIKTLAEKEKLPSHMSHMLQNIIPMRVRIQYVPGRSVTLVS
jgi:hypothetical protein